MSLQKPKTYRSEKYLKFVRSLPCCVSGSSLDVQTHHLFKSGTALKGDDLSCIPIRADLHAELHQIGWSTFQERHRINLIEENRNVLMKYVKTIEQDGEYL